MKELSLQEKLLHLGFTHNESNIYLALLRHGALKARDIISRTKFQRSAVYIALKSLIAKNLVSEAGGKVTEYTASDPQRLVEIQKEQVLEAELLVTNLNKERLATEKDVFVYNGGDIIQTVAEKTLQAQTDTTVYFFGPSKFGVQDNLEHFWKLYHKNREAKGLPARILYDRFVPKEIVKDRNLYKTCRAKYLPIGVEVPISFVIWNSHVAILVPGEKPPTVFFINSQPTADTLIEYFNYMWKMAV